MTEGAPRILLIGTADTKADELLYLRGRIEAGGGTALVMDVGVLDGSPFVPEIANAEVAAAAGTTTERLAALGDENAAMSGMARGAARLAAELHAAGRIDGLLALGGTMGTDLALDVPPPRCRWACPRWCCRPSPIRTCCRPSASRPISSCCSGRAACTA
jgi:uncharacterized protein (UPF0261 family)